MSIAIVDYGMGNTGSVKSALKLLGAEGVITAKPEDFKRASHIILPGVGAFPDGMKRVKACEGFEALEKEVLENKKPFLGICLGMQLLGEYGEEAGGAKGLGWIPGNVRRLKVDEAKFRLPHIGWNEVSFTGECPLFTGVVQKDFYFVHSYVLEPTDASTIKGTCTYGETFPVVVQKENIFGTQFHPEKSQKSGITVLKNFISL